MLRKGDGPRPGHSSDASLPLVTAQYKGHRTLGRSDEDSAGHVVPFEGTRQQNPC